jgi:septal ring factor EnvC (AmiA/AmiB activator)
VPLARDLLLAALCTIGVAHADDTINSLLGAQQDSAVRAEQQVDAKRKDAEATRAARVRAAYKLLRGAGSPLTVTPERRAAVARSRATARLLLARDQAEAKQLADEAAMLHAAVLRIAADRVAAAGLVLPAPGSLARPVTGEIARRFGTLEHERTKATLSRRGLDFDVADDAEVVAPADGVIRYAGPMRGLDHGLILDHGTTITILAKLDPIAYALGTRIERGAVIGYAAKRRVYFEVRVPVGPGGTPIDPEPLIAETHTSAR